MSPTHTDDSPFFEALLICLGVVILGYCPEPDRTTATSGQVQVKLSPEPVTEPRPVEPAAEVRDHRHAVVRIVVAEGPSTSRGSGVLVDHGGKLLVLTAWHVVRGNRDSIVVHFQDGTVSAARVVASDDAWDVAALECDAYGAAHAKVAAPQPKSGDKLTVIGYGPHPSTFREADGRLIGRARPTRAHPSDHIVVSAGARQGDSGGPIFNEAGEVAGILWGSTGQETYATHSGRLRKILDGDPASTPQVPLKSPCANGKCRKP